MHPQDVMHGEGLYTTHFSATVYFAILSTIIQQNLVCSEVVAYQITLHI